jgi:hypothetical protein
MRRLLAIVLASGFALSCRDSNPEWLLIEYPSAGDRTTMRFPGVRADSYEECLQQAVTVLKSRQREGQSYLGRLECGSQCRFSADWGSPLCDALLELDSTRLSLVRFKGER